MDLAQDAPTTAPDTGALATLGAETEHELHVMHYQQGRADGFVDGYLQAMAEVKAKEPARA